MSPKSEISEGQSKELCDRMNSHQSAFVYALALDHVRSSRGKMKSKVSFVKMNNISIDSYTLIYVECQSDSMCMMVSAKIEIDPPLDSGEHVRGVLNHCFSIFEPMFLSINTKCWMLVQGFYKKVIKQCPRDIAGCSPRHCPS